uniref:Mediator of RNA polymerase II transcription subunit 23 n=1 Tax=Panagrolaimus sp. JU765 TaxID=591449 RepID=A0AC34QAG8_9BILA
MIEQQCYFPVIEKLIIVFKYHPQPATFLYRTLYSFPREYIRHEWISRCVRQIAIQEHYRGQMKYCLLSECFIDKHSTALPMEICLKLIERVSKSTTYKHQPPEFCSRDWRFTELPPAAATLVGANIEMMINKHEPDVLINALLKCAFKRPLDKPFELLNSVGLLLTTLPEFFQRCFLEKFENYIDLPELVEEDKPAKILESFQVDAFLASDNDPLTALAIIHSFIQHSSNAGLTLLFTLVENMQAKVKNESQLMFLLRIIVPQLSRVDEVLTMELGACICKAIVSATKSKEQLVFEDTYCNLLYGIKYFKTGNRENLENLILQFPPKLREKMKYFHTSKEEQNEQLKSKQHALLQQQLSQQQMLQQRQQQQLQHHPSFLSTQVPSVPSSQFVPNMPSQPPPNFPEMPQRFPVVPPPQRLPIPMEIPQPDVKPKIEAEMVAPAVRADTLPGMAFQPTMIRPPDGHDMQQQRAPPMRSNPMPSGMPQMMQQMNMPP